MAYSTFERPSFRSSTATLSIFVQGRFALNAPMTRVFRGEGVGRVLLLYDKGQRKIGLAPLKKGARRDDRTYVITYHPNQRQAIIDSKLFLKAIGWDGRRYQLDSRWSEKDKLWDCELPDWQADGLKLLPPAAWEQRTGRIGLLE